MQQTKEYKDKPSNCLHQQLESGFAVVPGLLLQDLQPLAEVLQYAFNLGIGVLVLHVVHIRSQLADRHIILKFCVYECVLIKE